MSITANLGDKCYSGYTKDGNVFTLLALSKAWHPKLVNSFLLELLASAYEGSRFPGFWLISSTIDVSCTISRDDCHAKYFILQLQPSLFPVCQEATKDNNITLSDEAVINLEMDRQGNSAKASAQSRMDLLSLFQ